MCRINCRYHKHFDEGGRRHIGSAKAKSRLASSSSKGRNPRKSDHLEDNPYTSGLENNTQVAINEDDESNMINISTKDNLNKTEPGLCYVLLIIGINIKNAQFGREKHFSDLNNSHEQPINKHRDKDLLPNKPHKRRIFSSAGARKPRISKQRNRVQTAKYIRNVNKAVNTRWKGGSQLSNYNQKPKHPSMYGKYSEKKKMKVPLADYQWPVNNNNNANNQRPTTASHGNAGANLANYEEKRRNIQSRGKAIPTGLSGTSQSDQFDKGNKNINIV